MKKLFTIPLFLLCLFALAPATPVTVATSAVANPAVGRAPSINKVASGSVHYVMTWRTVSYGTTNVSFLTQFVYGPVAVFSPDSMFAATTYAEMQTNAASHGITNLPPDPALATNSATP